MNQQQLDQQRQYVLRAVEERGVKLIRLWFTDVLGQLKSVAISPAELDTALEEGLHFDGSAIDGFSRIQESDVLARPDPSSFELLPWADGGDGTTGRMFCDIYNPDGSAFEGDPRHVLRRNLRKAADDGYGFFVAPEMEFFYFADGEPVHKPQLLDSGGYFDLTTSDVASDLRRETISVLETMGIPVEYSFHEDSPSQHEIDLRYTDALTMADQIMTFRLVVRELALERGRFASFMPKPLAGMQGSGMHLHLSLSGTDDDGLENNAFHADGAEYALSDTARMFTAGLMRHAREITAVTNQLVNSYKRLVVGYEAPIWVSWAQNNRSALIRVPVTRPDKTTSTRIEYRSPDPSCNPYLAFSVILAAGMKGVREGYELPDEITENLFEVTPAQVKALGIDALPASLSEALDEMEKSELVHEALGDHIFEWFLRNKRTEWRDYKAHVSQWELERYLPSW